MLVDIEMPRLDGFDLTRNIRSDARLKAIPIIMITSRTGEKHRNYAMEIGVNHFLGKPFQEEELLALVAGYVSQRRSA
jgi:chemosensory pili system protein ChpA (sensor histidine kinase/response regulator)